MKTLFDLRKEGTQKIIQEIQGLFTEALNVVRIEENSVRSCIGCWNCWLKTPGVCVMNDQIAESYPDYINSDTVILLLDTAQGFINHLAKAFLDRTIPHYMPYVELKDGECHHVARYKAYPDMVFYFDTKGLTEDEEQVIEDYLYRAAYQFKSKPFRIIEDDGFKLKALETRKAKNRTVPFDSSVPMEKLVIYNGSPRRTRSNSAMILSSAAGKLGEKIEIRDLKEESKWDEWADAFSAEKNVMFFMPLYVHALPSHVMRFIEKLQASEGNICFFVQSGFPESSQSYYLEAYLERLAARLGRKYIGTAIKGGVEGLQVRPAKQQEQIIKPMIQAIASLVEQGKFDQSVLKQISKPEFLSPGMRVMFNIAKGLGLTNFFWDNDLKKNNAYTKRFDHPFQN